MRFLITGISGFAGRHLAAHLMAEGHDVFGVTREEPAAPLPPAVPGVSSEAIFWGDVCDPAIVNRAVHDVDPDGIFHLAAQSSVSKGEGDAARTFTVNSTGTLEVLAAAQARRRRCRVLLVSSGECYGLSAAAGPIVEDTPLRPMSVYAASKVASEVLLRQAVDAYGADAVCVRAFNHTGPGQSPTFVCADFARQIVAVERGVQPAVRVGNLDAVRDFLDVRDTVRAYAAIWQRGESGGVYNVSSGVGRRIGDILEALRGLANGGIEVEPDPQRLRPADVPVLIGDNRRVRALGWQPTIAWQRTLSDLIASWRA